MKKKSVKSKDKHLHSYFAMDDFFFLKYMGEKGNELQQKSFLKALGIDIKGKITITNTKMSSDKVKGKRSELDLRIITSCEKDVNIEVQRQETEDFLERLLIYCCKRAIEPIAKGNNYKSIKKIIAVAICKYSFLKSPKYHNIFHISNSNIYIPEKLIDKLEIHIIEMEKFRKENIYEEHKTENGTKTIIKTKKDLINNRKHQYLAFIDDETTHEERKEIVKMGDEGLKASMKCLELALQNGAFDEYFYQKMNEFHHENVMKEKKEEGIKIGEEKGKEEGIKIGEEKGKEEGIKIGEEKGIKIGEEKGIKIGEEKGKEEGIKIGEEKGKEEGIKIGEEKGIKIGEEKGKEEGKLEIALTLKIKGFPLEIIAETTGLPISKIEKL